ncbi:cation/H(+) antiporter 4-like [Gastrolobium bilobum]|uniref:cation/H(+) antiporter 4-like n=1 Tax=Gastrolobium bilobum TaxID=150636 RepID=UPI002AB0D66B|nr:cation/H(+) antiporter 4-like [Gastrolobium bilobum]
MPMFVNQTLFAFATPIESNHSAAYNVCIDIPPHIVSDGFWGGHQTEGSPLKSSFPVFMLQIIVIYAVTQPIHFLLKKFGLPVFISQMMAGILIGPSLNVFEQYKMMLFPFGSQDTLATITSLGYVLFMFENGVKMDIGMIFRTGKKGWVIGFLGLATPLIVGYASYNFVTKNVGATFGSKKNAFGVVLITQSITSFAVIASVLNELQILNSELGRLTLSSSLVGDLLSNIILGIGSIVDKSPNSKVVGISLGATIALIIVIFFVYRPAMYWVIEHTPEGKEVDDIYINIIIGILFTLGAFSMLMNLEFFFLPFLFGLATPEGPPLGSTLVKRIQLFGSELFLPIYFTICGIKVDLSDFVSFLPTVAPIVLLGHLIKMGTCMASALYFMVPFNDALCLSLLMNYKGVQEISMYNAALDKNDLHSQTYTTMITIVMVISSILYVLVKRFYDPSRKYAGYQNRNILSVKPNSYFRILVCIHKQHQTIPIIRTLDLCYPTEEDPIVVEALHLIELVGLSSPIFISHKLKNGEVRSSYSENVILAFKLYEGDKPGAVSANPYTAISPRNFMHEDVCNLALDKVASFIILPFHRKLTNDGNIKYDDKNVRALNCMVLERAPCSVGILVSRAVIHHEERDSSLELAMIFLGGNDDREALCLAYRAARDPTVNLVVYHIVAENNDGIPDLDTMIDIGMLKDAKNERMGNVNYREIQVEGGIQTVSMLRQIVNVHDFIIVGRRHGIDSLQTRGLQEWSEFSELGLIGDFLASADLECNSSVLVVQQQQQHI